MKRLTRVVLASVGILSTAALVAAVIAAPTLSGTTSATALPATIASSGANLTVNSVASDTSTVATGGAAASADLSTPTVHTVYVSATLASASSTDDINGGINETSARALVASMNDYWSKESNGRVTIVFGGYEVRALKLASCTPATVFANAPTTAFDGRFANSAWTGTQDHLLVLTVESCNAAGLGSVGGGGGIMLSGNGVNSDISVPVATHEFGHNLGFGHAGSSVCANGAQDADATLFGGDASICPTVEYADYLDIMGYSLAGAMPHLSSAQRIRSGWMSDFTTVTSATGSATTTITSLDGAAGNRAIKITDPISGANYYVEYRTASGADATSTEFTQTETCFTAAGYSNCSRGTSTETGSLRIIKELPYRDYTDYVRTTVIAAGSTGSGDAYRSTHFAVGDTFTSANGGFYLTVNSLNSTAGASVTVRFAPAVQTSTALSLSTSTQAYGATSETTTATIDTADGSIANGTVSFFDGTKMLATVPVVNNAAVLANPATLKIGTHKLSARFIPASGDWGKSSTGKSALKVTKATSKATISKIKRSRAKLTGTVTVKVAGLKKPTGTVAIYANGKKLKTYKLTAKQSGKISVSIKLAKKYRSGTVKITARYSGTSTVQSKTSSAKRL